MFIPSRSSLEKFFLGTLFIYAIVWISLEGRLWQALLLAFGIDLIVTAYLWRRYLGRRTEVKWRRPLLAGLIGLLASFNGAIVTLLLMILKTGLHAHGPEFSSNEFEWVMMQVPLWSSSGFLAGIGAGLIDWGMKR